MPQVARRRSRLKRLAGPQTAAEARLCQGCRAGLSRAELKPVSRGNPLLRVGPGGTLPRCVRSPSCPEAPGADMREFTDHSGGCSQQAFRRPGLRYGTFHARIGPNRCKSGVKNDITAAQVRAARALIGWNRERLAAASGSAVRTLVRLEAGTTAPHATTAAAIRTALEAAGVEFIAENGGGPGVRLRKTASEQST